MNFLPSLMKFSALCNVVDFRLMSLLNVIIFILVLLLYPLATVQMEHQVFKGRVPYRNGLIRCANDDNEDDVEMGSSESESNTASNDSVSNEECSVTAL